VAGYLAQPPLPVPGPHWRNACHACRRPAQRLPFRPDGSARFPVPISARQPVRRQRRLYQLAERRHERLGDPLTAITLLASLIDQAERMIPEHVLQARDHGASWHDIAVALATSPEQAELRSSPDSPIADSRWPYNY
jgi:hypothetical protein